MALDSTSPAECEPRTDTADEGAVNAQDAESSVGESAHPPAGNIRPRHRRWSRTRVGLCAGLIIVLALGGLLGWVGYGLHREHAVTERRDGYLAVGRQAALNLTTIDWQSVDSDIQRIVDSSTSDFRDEFTARSKPFAEVVRQAGSKSVGTVVAAGVQSESDEGAQVLVAVSVKTATRVAPQQDPRSWRMQISVQQTDAGMKVSKVLFVG
ncbi:Mce protein [Mycobacterium sp. NPDC003449]